MTISFVRSRHRLTRAVLAVIVFARIEFQQAHTVFIAPRVSSYDDPLGLKLWSRMKNACKSFCMRLHRHNHERYEIVQLKI
ncbi:MAG: hypothetical protein KIH67_002250 [Candidatus Moranbacteria bacterium]|nr:hypothetical protein [Candidatus Moranbacteria bacterium]